MNKKGPKNFFALTREKSLDTNFYNPSPPNLTSDLRPWLDVILDWMWSWIGCDPGLMWSLMHACMVTKLNHGPNLINESSLYCILVNSLLKVTRDHYWNFWETFTGIRWWWWLLGTGRRWQRWLLSKYVAPPGDSNAMLSSFLQLNFLPWSTGGTDQPTD